MSGRAQLHAISLLRANPTLKFGQTVIELDDVMSESLRLEIQKVADGTLPQNIQQIELTEAGGLYVHAQGGESHAVSQLRLPVQALLEEHLFERGMARYAAQVSRNEGTFKAKCVQFAEKYGSPAADAWGAIRNSAGLTMAVIKILALTGVITLAPHAFATMLLIYGCFILVQALLSLGPLMIGGASNGILQGRMAEELGDKTHQTSARLKKWGAFFSFVEGSFWLVIAVVDIYGLAKLSSLLMKILFWGVFNFTFIYMASCAGRDYARHKKFRAALKSRLEQPDLNDLQRYHAALSYVRAKWHIHLKQKHAHYSEPELVQKAGRKIYRFLEQTSEGTLESMAKVDALLARLENQDATALNEAKVLVGELLVENKRKLVADAVTIFLGVVGVMCWFDVTIVWAGAEHAGDIVDWVLWVLLNLGFLLMSSWERFSSKIADYYTRGERPQIPSPILHV